MKIILTIILFQITSFSFGQYVSLKADDLIDDIPITYLVGSDTIRETVTVIKSAANDYQWYYIPNKPRLYERQINGSQLPDFTLLSYIVNNPEDNSKLVDGGILQFTATVQLPDECITELKKIIESKKNLAGVSLSALPVKSAEVNLYAPMANGGKDSLQLFTSSPKGSGLAPIFATQNMSFSVPLSRVGSDVIDALVNSNTGIAVVYSYSFYGIVKAGFSVTVDFKQLFHHYSSDSKFAAKASYLGLFGASYQNEKQEVYQELKNSSCITININPGENLSEQQITDQFITPILNSINNEILENSKLPAVISPASAADISNSGRFFSAGYSVSTKNIDINTLTTRTIDFNVNQLIERKTLASGFIGIGSYPDNIKKALVITVSKSKFQEADFTAPPILDSSLAAKLGISRVAIEIEPLDKDGKSLSQSFSRWWDIHVPNVWQCHSCSQPNIFAYGWHTSPANDDDLKSYKFGIYTKIEHDGPPILDTIYGSFDPRERLLDAIYESKFDIVSIDPSQLSFHSLIDTSNLIKVIATINYDNHSKTFDNIVPTNINGVKSAPTIIYYPIGNHSLSSNHNEVDVDITFILKDGTHKFWKGNERNLLEIPNGLSINLFDSDWK